MERIIFDSSQDSEEVLLLEELLYTSSFLKVVFQFHLYNGSHPSFEVGYLFISHKKNGSHPSLEVGYLFFFTKKNGSHSSFKVGYLFFSRKKMAAIHPLKQVVFLTKKIGSQSYLGCLFFSRKKMAPIHPLKQAICFSHEKKCQPFIL